MLSIVDEPFVPGTGDLLDTVARRWDALRRENPHYYDGRLYHVFGVHRNGHGGAVIHVADCAYRLHAVQDEDFDLGVRPLGVKGVVERDGRFLLGRRASCVGSYRNLWEFAPAGVVEPGRTPEETVGRELREEVGLTPHGTPRAIAVLYDDVLRCWEVVLRIEPAETSDAVPPSTAEYESITWCRLDALPEGMTPIAERMAVLLGG